MINLSIVPLWAKILVISLILAGVGAYGYHLGYDARDYIAVQAENKALLDREKQIKDLRISNEAQRVELRVASKNLTSALESVRERKIYITRTVTKEIEKPIYVDCVVPDSGTKILKDNAIMWNKKREK